MANTDKLEASLIYPREVKIRDGRNVSLRLMEAGDNQRILNFANSLPPDDLLFLRTDITDPRTIDEWVQSIEAGTTITVVAELDSGVVGGLDDGHEIALSEHRVLGNHLATEVGDLLVHLLHAVGILVQGLAAFGG